MTGADVACRLARPYRRPIDSVVLFCGELIDITAYRHHQGIVHTDLRPAKVKVRPEGGLCLLDFGMAASGMGPQGDAYSMAPGQWAGQRGSARAAIYPPSIVCDRMVTGVLALSGS